VRHKPKTTFNGIQQKNLFFIQDASSLITRFETRFHNGFHKSFFQTHMYTQNWFLNTNHFLWEPKHICTYIQTYTKKFIQDISLLHGQGAQFLDELERWLHYFLVPHCSCVTYERRIRCSNQIYARGISSFPRIPYEGQYNLRCDTVRVENFPRSTWFT
jgi:hypothetical protein